jgi:hypothetical protein
MDDKTTIKRIKREKVWELTDTQQTEFKNLANVTKIANDAMADTKLKMMEAEVAKTRFWNNIKKGLPDEPTRSTCELTIDDTTMSVYVEPDNDSCPLNELNEIIRRTLSGNRNDKGLN